MDGVLEPLEIGRFHYKKRSLEDYVGTSGRKSQGRKKWQRQVEAIVARLVQALQPDGGGNAKKLRPLPPGTRLGDNAFAFLNGFHLRELETACPRPATPGGNGRDRPAAISRQPGQRGRSPSQTPEQMEVSR
jgi:hypothetical protein